MVKDLNPIITTEPVHFMLKEVLRTSEVRLFGTGYYTSYSPGVPTTNTNRKTISAEGTITVVVKGTVGTKLGTSIVILQRNISVGTNPNNFIEGEAIRANIDREGVDPVRNMQKVDS